MSDSGANKLRPGMLGRLFLGGHTWVVPLGLLALLALCSILWLTGPKITSTSPAQSSPVEELSGVPMLYQLSTAPEVLYLVQYDPKGNSDVYRVEVGTPVAMDNLTHSRGVSEYWPVPSPDASLVAFFAMDRSQRGSLMLRRADGSVIDLTYHTAGTGLAEDYEVDIRQAPLWSPGGDWIAFLARHTNAGREANELFVARSNGTETRRLTSLGTRISDPLWITDAQLVCLALRNDGKASLFNVPITQTTTLLEPLVEAVRIRP